MVHPIEPNGGTQRPPNVRHQMQRRADELAEQLMSLDRKWHDRVKFLQSKDTSQYHIDHDIILRNLGGATKVVSDMLAAMSTYLLATRPDRGPR